MKNQFEIHSLSKGTYMQARPYSGAVFLSWSVDTKQSSGERGCTIRTKYNVNAFVQNASTSLQTPLKWPLQNSTSFVVFSNPIDSFCSDDSSILESFANPVDFQLLVKWLLMRQLLMMQLLMMWLLQLLMTQLLMMWLLDLLSSEALFFRSSLLQKRYFFRSSLTSGALCLQNHLSFISFCSLFAHSEPNNDVTF